MKPLYIETISLYGPGLPSWQEAALTLLAPETYREDMVGPLQSTFLSSGIKRKTSQHMQLAIYAADKALEGTDTDPNDIEFVFASSEGDLNIAHHICYSLTLEGKPVSPTKFQNVILNAAAGHLGILMKNTASATTVTAASHSLAVGLLQSYTTSLTESTPILYVAYDAPALLKIDPDAAPIDPFSVGFLLSPSPSKRSIASIRLSLQDGTQITPVENANLSRVSTRSSAAGVLPLMIALAKQQQETVVLPYSNQQVLSVEVTPC
ncbi:beta-ketoacyl synthase chain length factor [Dyella tabacisoli]|uniref:Beta-ketoacyl synthase-like N-terminal domain-containing protein n=1 Tax=Dyella tabacisoli TaxID=2282381 RepID=A0A369ULU5_9GAMM|nr:beta-ketoacyl synthase chain length factor [Dyella tabacisoli]RDD81313.1 hypothetical protein DVJ77_13475 [Dyella tabacisoli]